MAKEIGFGLSTREIQNAIKEVNKYQSRLALKCNELCRRLTVTGTSIALAHIAKSSLGKTITLRSEINPGKMGCKALLFSIGEVKQAEGYEPFNTLLAVEFGAGIYLNPTPNPKANEFGMGVGTFPGQVHAFEDGWYYLGEDDKWHYSHGVQATMPMYHAAQGIKKQVTKVAKEVFKT